VEFVAVDDELRVGSAAEFVEVHAEAFAFALRTEGHDFVEQAEDEVNDGDEHPEQGGDADQLGEDLSGAVSLGRESPHEADGDESPDAHDAVYDDGSGGVVDGHSQFQKLDQQGRDDAGDAADEDGRAGADEAGEPLAQRLASGLPKRARVMKKVASTAAEAESMVLRAVDATPVKGELSSSREAAPLLPIQPTRASRQPSNT